MAEPDRASARSNDETSSVVRMRILIVSNIYPPEVIGGYELLMHDIAGGLRKSGHDVRVLTTEAPVRDDPGHLVDRVLVRRAHNAMQAEDAGEARHVESVASFLPNSLALARAIAGWRPDRIVLGGLLGLGGLAILDLVRFSGVPWGWYLADKEPARLTEALPGSVLEVFDEDGTLLSGGCLVAMSRRLVDEIREEARLDIGEPVIIPGWVTHVPVVSDDGGAVLGERSRRVRFVSAGRIAEHKGIGLILEAASRLSDRAPEFSVDLYGAGDTELWQAEADRLGVDQIVRFRGMRTRSELLDEYRSADAFLFPTHEREPFGLAPLEAAASGCAPIITAGTGVAEALEDGVHAVHIERTADALVEAMIRVLDGDVTRGEMGRAARSRVEEGLDFASLGPRVEQALVAGDGAAARHSLEALQAHVVERDRVALEAWNIDRRARRDAHEAAAARPSAVVRRGWAHLRRLTGVALRSR